MTNPTPAPDISEERLDAWDRYWRNQQAYNPVAPEALAMSAEVRRLRQQVEQVEDLINNGRPGMEAFDLRLAIDAILGSSHG